MDTHVWEALPQRKRKRHVNAAAATSAVADHDTITNNVNARSTLQRNNATLEVRPCIDVVSNSIVVGYS